MKYALLTAISKELPLVKDGAPVVMSALDVGNLGDDGAVIIIADATPQSGSAVNRELGMISEYAAYDVASAAEDFVERLQDGVVGVIDLGEVRLFSLTREGILDDLNSFLYGDDEVPANSPIFGLKDAIETVLYGDPDPVEDSVEL